MTTSHLPININDLLNPNVVEIDRIEFKEGWNPDAIIRTLGAFANDFHDIGGGYIVIGVKEVDGQPQLPPVGVPLNKIDSIQQELLRYCNLLQPTYLPHFSVEELHGQRVIVLWAPGGQNRPYKAPDKVTSRDKAYHYYIRQYSNTVKANAEQERELIRLTATIPFDDRTNPQATLNDLQLPLIQSFLKEIRSGLHADSGEMPFDELCRNMRIADGGAEFLRPLNVGLMFFCENPERFFPETRIEVVEFPAGVAGGKLEEKIFHGPIQQQIRDALAYLEKNVLKKRTIKHPDRAEAEQIANYPYVAVEEALVNALYHRGYDVNEPVEVRVNPESLEIVSYPGPVPSVNLSQLRRGRVIARRYRNRRVGEFLKELKLTEGRATGIPDIFQSLKENGSGPPEFEFDEERTYFLARLPIHPGWVKGGDEEAEGRVKGGVRGGVEGGVEGIVEIYSSLTETEKRLLELISKKPMKSSEIAESIGYKMVTGSLRKRLEQLESLGLVDLTIPEKPSSRNQQRRITEKGLRVLQAGTAGHEKK